MTLNSKMRGIHLTVNGLKRKAIVRNADTLLHVLRDQLGLTGAKEGCGNGDCGACTVLVGNRPVHACHMLAVEAAERQLTTIEGMRETPIQQALVDRGAIQCGYCIPGVVMNVHSLIEHHPNADEHVIEDWLSSNLCRCTGYMEMKEAVKDLVEAHRT